MIDYTVFTDNEKLGLNVENDHLYVFSDCCGCGDEIADVSTVKKLRDELTSLLERINARS